MWICWNACCTQCPSPPPAINFIKNPHHLGHRSRLRVGEQVIGEFTRLAQIHEQHFCFAVFEPRSEQPIDCLSCSLRHQPYVIGGIRPLADRALQRCSNDPRGDYSAGGGRAKHRQGALGMVAILGKGEAARSNKRQSRDSDDRKVLLGALATWPDACAGKWLVRVGERPKRPEKETAVFHQAQG